MRTTTLLKSTVVLTALFAYPMVAEAGLLKKEGAGHDNPHAREQCVHPPLSSFISAQGTSSRFFPPVQDYVGWTDHAPTVFALVDYAGLANKWITQRTGHSLGTEVKGFVRICKLTTPAPNGNTAQVTVDLFTSRALGFEMLIADLPRNPPYTSTPTIFGSTAQGVVFKHKQPALGSSTLSTTFTIPSIASPLPDFLNVSGNGSISPKLFAPIRLSFASEVDGTCANGKPATLRVHETATSDDNGEFTYTDELVHSGCEQ